MKRATGAILATGAIAAAALSGYRPAEAFQGGENTAGGSRGHGRPVYLDLTHTIPTFEPLSTAPNEPDLSKPHADSKAVPSFFRQAVLDTSTNSTGPHQGHFYRACLTINGWNFPGVSLAAINELIAIENRRGIRINGIAIDNIGIDSGEGEAGIDQQFTNSFQSHVRGLQRGWKFIENATNLGAVASAKPDSCTLVAGALPIVRGSGSPARVIAICQR